MNAGELFQAGKLQEAIAEAIQQVKAHPEDMSQRTLLFSLLCFEGDLPRAKKQIEVVDHQATLSEAAAYSNLLAAEETRRKKNKTSNKKNNLKIQIKGNLSKEKERSPEKKEEGKK